MLLNMFTLVNYELVRVQVVTALVAVKEVFN